MIKTNKHYNLTDEKEPKQHFSFLKLKIFLNVIFFLKTYC